jgi:hypothetical protein
LVNGTSCIRSGLSHCAAAFAACGVSRAALDKHCWGAAAIACLTLHLRFTSQRLLLLLVVLVVSLRLCCCEVL